MIQAGVIGHPISHSKSPRIHGYWLQHYGIDGTYTAIDIAPGELAEHVQQLKDQGFAGFNVTIPHKQAIMPLCDTLSDAARSIGAVNTVVIRDGRLHGDNTDAFGFTRNLEETIPDFDWTQAPALVIGAGGAARAVMWALKDKGVPEIRITNRTADKAQDLASLYGGKVIAWEDRSAAIAGVGLVINTSALGMAGQPKLEIGLRALGKDTVVYDIVYTPLMTDLLQQAQAQQCRIVTGIGMLLHQARPGFAAWFGGDIPTVTDDLRQRLLS